MSSGTIWRLAIVNAAVAALLTLADLSPGPYTLQVTIAPGIDGKQGRALRQWVDFDVR